MTQKHEWELEFGGIWPRGLGNPYRTKIAHNANDLVEFAEANNYTNIFTTVYGYTSYDDPKVDSVNAIINCLPYDFDSKDLNCALADAKKLTAWCHRHDIEPRVKFSGSKGFHGIIDFEPIELSNTKGTLKQFGTELCVAAEFTTADRVVLGDVNRLLRVTNTIHPKTNLYCISMDSYDFMNSSLEEILELAKEPQYLHKHYKAPYIEDIHAALMDIDAKFKKVAKVENSHVDTSQSKLARIFVAPPQIKCRAAEYLVAYGADEGARDLAISGIIRYYAKLGMSKDQIREKCALFSNKCPSPLRQSYIDYKLNYHMKSKYTPCAFLRNIDGLCNGCAKNFNKEI